MKIMNQKSKTILRKIIIEQTKKNCTETGLNNKCIKPFFEISHPKKNTKSE